LAAHPDVVTVWLAVNDLKDGVPLASYERQLDRLVGALTATGAVVAVGNLPDLSALPVAQTALGQFGPSGRAMVHAEIARWNAEIARVVRKHGAVLVDLHAGWKEVRAHPEYLSADGFHPSSEGYRVLAQLWRGRLEAAGAFSRLRAGE
ncbi:MAG: GDSL-type esterase/lipase family protein, partial [Chloroflexota bacterium]|nr:GDSL-type esterase/lipase family protein [Chloroflexota bacterium]